GGEGAQLVHHRVDGVLQLEDLAAHVDGDLLRQVTGGDGGRHLGDVPDLRRQVGGHEVHAVGQVLPGAGHAADVRLTAQLALPADLQCAVRIFGGEGAKLVHHRVDGVLHLEDLALHVDRDLLREVAARDGGGHLGDVPHLAGQVGGHEVHALGEV